MPTSEVAKRYFAALDAHDLDAAAACWQPGAIDRFVGEQELIAPEGVRDYFASLFDAFPDFSLEIIELTTSHARTAVRWRGRGTFAGPGSFQGFEPNGARIEIEGCDVITAHGDLIEHNDAYMNSAEIARQLGMLPPAGSPAEVRLTKAANFRTRLRNRLHGANTERIADGVWLVQGGLPKRMNVYLLADEGRITVFDAGISDMTSAVAAAGARLGGIDHVVLGHADADHRGVAAALGLPVYCHELEREAAESPASFRTYFDLTKLPPYARPVYRRLLPHWDGGPVQITTTVHEGDHIAGFTVIELPGHAPGLIGLFRESDRLALCSDCVYTVDAPTGRKVPAQMPHSAFNLDDAQARASIRKLAGLRPSVVWAGHADPVTGDVVGQLERAAAAVV
jgi:glyoxylase-like metal-dependent hydrolase (beta-lactamase superfamily II)/predicted ester cyclase